ncbi:MAG: hypothetical protein Fur003_3160 [Candidatus Dojkabacteria bacterium]
MNPAGLDRRSFIKTALFSAAAAIVPPPDIPEETATMREEIADRVNSAGTQIKPAFVEVGGTAPLDLSAVREGGELRDKWVATSIEGEVDSLSAAITVSTKGYRFGYEEAKRGYRAYLPNRGITLYTEVADGERSDNNIDVLTARSVNINSQTPMRQEDFSTHVQNAIASTGHELHALMPIDPTKGVNFINKPQRAPSVVEGSYYYKIENPGTSSEPTIESVKLIDAEGAKIISYTFPANEFANADTGSGVPYNVTSQDVNLRHNPDGSVEITMQYIMRVGTHDNPLKDEARMLIYTDGTIESNYGGHRTSFEPFDSGQLNWSTDGMQRSEQAMQIVGRALALTQMATKHGYFVGQHQPISAVLARAMCRLGKTN